MTTQVKDLVKLKLVESDRTGVIFSPTKTRNNLDEVHKGPRNSDERRAGTNHSQNRGFCVDDRAGRRPSQMLSCEVLVR